MPRGPPPPRNGLPMPTSPVAVKGRKPMPRPAASIPLLAGSAIKFGNSGLEKFRWLKMLKNSARSWRITRSVIAVFLKIEKFISLKLGPKRTLRRRLPKWRVPARQLLSPEDVLAVVLPNAHGTWKEARLMKLLGVLPYWIGPTTSGRSNPSPDPE